MVSGPSGTWSDGETHWTTASLTGWWNTAARSACTATTTTTSSRSCQPIRFADGSTPDWRAYFASSAWAYRWMLPLLRNWREVLFPGFLVTFGGAVGAWLVATGVTRTRRDIAAFYGLVAALAIWLSFGPQAGLYTAPYETVPVMSLIRAPVRVAVLVPLSLAVLSALGLAAMTAGLDRRRCQLVGAAAALLVTLELVESPIQW
jgi:hypothetical protein